MREARASRAGQWPEMAASNSSRPLPPGVVLCPHCSGRVAPRADLRGRSIACPICREPFIVPEVAASAATAPPQKPAAKPSGKAPDRNADLVPVVCGTCGTRMYANRGQIGKKIRCPDCNVIATVRAPAQVAKKKPRREVDEYALVDDEPQAQRPTTSQPATDEHPSTQSAAPEQELILVVCPLCATRMHFRAADAGSVANCPDCDTQVVVTAPREVARRTAPDLQVGEYGVGEVQVGDQPRPVLLATRFIADEQLRQEDAPQQDSSFLGAFLFPWTATAIGRWVYLSLALAALGAVGALLASLYAQGGNPMAGFAMAFPAFAVAWGTIWAGSYFAACVEAIIRDTAAAAAAEIEWPISDWREWIYPLLHLVLVNGAAAAVGYGVRALAGLEGPWCMLTSAYLLGPVFLLSTLESGNPLVVFSWPVFRSLILAAGYWLAFYLLLACVFAAGVAVVVASTWLPPLLTGMVAAPSIATMGFIAARLLGHLALCISGHLVPQDRSAADD